MIKSALIVIIGSSIPMGYGIGFLNCPQAIIRKWIQEAMEKNYGITLTIHQNVLVWSSVISIFLVGCTIGSLKSGALADKLGRRNAFLFNYLLILLSCGVFGFCKIFHYLEVLLTSQLLFGISAGISCSLVPLYLFEIENESFRGLAVIHAFGISIGMFISQICGMELLLGSGMLWPYLSCIPASGALIAILFHKYLQESPVYVSFIIENAIQRKYLLDTNKKVPLLISNSDQSEPEKYTLFEVFKEKNLYKPIFLSLLLYVNTAFSGMNAIVAFGNVIFTSAGLNQLQSEVASICATGLRCVMGILAIILTKKCRRRPQLLTSLGGCAMSLIMLVLSLSYHGSIASHMAIFSCAMYFTFYAIGIGALSCAISAELLPNKPRPLIMSLASAIYWITNILVGSSFPIVENIIGAYSLVFFIFYCIISGIIIYNYLPETSNRDSVIQKINELHRQYEKSKYELIS